VIWWVIGGIVGFVLLGEIVLHCYAIAAAVPIVETRPPFGPERFPPDPTAESLSFRTRDGLLLSASLFHPRGQAPRGLVLFCHELESNRWSAPAYLEAVLQAGFSILAFDFRNHGDSDSQNGYVPLHWLAEHDLRDVEAALEFIAERSDLAGLPLGIFGVSRGGCAALITAARSARIRAVVTDGAYSSELLVHFSKRWGSLYFPEAMMRIVPRWHIAGSMLLVREICQFRKGFRFARVERALPRLERKPLLMISGEADTYVVPEVVRWQHARTGHAPDTLWLVPGAKHNMSRQTAPEEYDRRVTEFFLAHLALDATASARRVNGDPEGIRAAPAGVQTA
jgi:pimeloyl-ACP methyl ester carboxylesterase